MLVRVNGGGTSGGGQEMAPQTSYSSMLGMSHDFLYTCPSACWYVTNVWSFQISVSFPEVKILTGITGYVNHYAGISAGPNCELIWQPHMDWVSTRWPWKSFALSRRQQSSSSTTAPCTPSSSGRTVTSGSVPQGSRRSSRRSRRCRGRGCRSGSRSDGGTLQAWGEGTGPVAVSSCECQMLQRTGPCRAMLPFLKSQAMAILCGAFGLERPGWAARTSDMCMRMTHLYRAHRCMSLNGPPPLFLVGNLVCHIWQTLANWGLA